MSYQAYLWRLLEPLGVYSGEGYSGAELKALGTALDRIAGKISENCLEMLPMTAQGDGLLKARAMYPFHALPEAADDIRAALKVVTRVDHSCFTAFAVEQTLSGLGVKVGLVVKGPEWVSVVFQEQLTKETDIVQALYLIELVLPCHIHVECTLRYLDAETGELVNEKTTLDELRKRTKTEWDSLMQ